MSALSRAHEASAKADELLKPDTKLNSDEATEGMHLLEQAVELYTLATQGKSGAVLNTIRALKMEHEKRLAMWKSKLASSDSSHAAKLRPAQLEQHKSEATDRRPPSETSAALVHNVKRHNSTPASPLGIASSSTSSSTKGSDSFLYLKSPDASDPFQHFLDEIDGVFKDFSHAVAFTSVPIRAPSSSDAPKPSLLASPSGKTPTTKRSKKKSAPSPLPAAPIDKSYYMVDPGNNTSPSPSTTTPEFTSSKTPEELILENKLLRESLDVSANRTAQLEALIAERKTLDSAALKKVRREAERAIHTHASILGEKLNQSMMLQSRAHFPAAPSTSSTVISELDVAKKRIVELEHQVQTLKQDNAKHKQRLQEYKQEYERLMEKARKKRDESKAQSSVGSRDS